MVRPVPAINDFGLGKTRGTGEIRGFMSGTGVDHIQKIQIAE
jgi:hypothetical protein